VIPQLLPLISSADDVGGLSGEFLKWSAAEKLHRGRYYSLGSKCTEVAHGADVAVLEYGVHGGVEEFKYDCESGGVANVVAGGEMKRKNERRKLPLERVSERDREMAGL